MKRKSIIFRENNLIKIVAYNTKNIFLFDNNNEIFNKLNGKAFYETAKAHHLYYYVNKIRLYAHHLMLPKKEGYDVDHINRDPRDNRISNLRYVTRSENIFNQRVAKDNKSGITGISWNKRDRKWEVYIAKDGKHLHLGKFNNIENAIVRRLAAEMILFPNIKYEEK